MVTSGRLAEFLEWLAENPEQADAFNANESVARRMMGEHGLSSDEQEVMFTRSPAAILSALSQQGYHSGRVIVPFGPIKGLNAAPDDAYWGELSGLPLPIRFFECTLQDGEAGTMMAGAALPVRAGGTRVRRRPASRTRKTAAKRGAKKKTPARRSRKTGRKK
jgi:hypothetical protein